MGIRESYSSGSKENNMAGGKKEKQFAPMIGWVYDLCLWIFSVLVDLFFREVHPRGSWKVPKRGAVIFVAAPHANQVWFLSSSFQLGYECSWE